MLGGRFLAPFLENDIGLSATEIGVCLACQQIILTVASSFAGKAADARETSLSNNNFRHQRYVGRVQIMLLGVVVATTAFLCHGACRGIELLQHSLLWHAFLQSIQGLVVAMVFPVLDGLTIDYLQQEVHSDRQDYGRERLHGPLWWALANFALSMFLDKNGFRVCYPLSIIAAVFVMISAFIFLSNYTHRQQLQQHQPTHQEGGGGGEQEEANFVQINCSFGDATEETESSSDGEYSENHEHGQIVVDTEDVPAPDQLSSPITSAEVLSLMDLLKLLLTPTSCGAAFLVCVVCISSGQVVVDNLVFLFFEALGSKWISMGVTVVIKIAFEVPIFYTGPHLLKRFGTSVVLLLGCVCYLVRVVAYTWLPQGHMIYPLLLEPLHGVTYGSTQLAMVDFVAQVMPRGYEATGQGLVYLFKDGGSVLGILFGGLADNSSHGPHLMFTMSAGIVSAGILVLMLAQLQAFRMRYYNMIQTVDA